MKNLTVLCGGQSTEHEISLLSAQNVIKSHDPAKYSLTVIYICDKGRWYRLREHAALDHLLKGCSELDSQLFEPITASLSDPGMPWLSLESHASRYRADLVFPVLHGFQGEDGCVQGLLTLLGLPYVGADTLASAVIMNKIRTRQVLNDRGIACVPYHAWYQGQNFEKDAMAAFASFDGQVFTKPCNSGSSIGVRHITDVTELMPALEHGLEFDSWVMMEPAMTGREFEVAVLGNRESFESAGPGEIVMDGGFYSYDAKYADSSTAVPTLAVKMSDKERQHVLSIACDAAQALDCEGMCRVDGFLQDGKFVINEVNTIPGFTAISLYPKIWAHAGKTARDLIDDLLTLAEQRQARDSTLNRHYLTQVSA